MAKITLIGTPQSRVRSEPIIPGSLIFTDEHRLYWDSPDRIRYEVADILELESEAERQAITKPLSKFYFVLSTNTLYRYNNGWKNISAGSGTGGGGGETEPYELTIDKLIPFASNTEPKPVDSVASPGIAGEYARADHVHKFSFEDVKMDFGYFPGTSPPTPVAIHNIAVTAHPFLVIDGNVQTPSRSDYPDIVAHTADPLAHSDLIVDGNDLTGELQNIGLAEHSVNRRSHPNIKIDGNLIVGQ